MNIDKPSFLIIKDLGVFTAQEHRIIGSTPEDEMLVRPFTPGILLKNGLSVDEVNDRRKIQGRIGSHSAGYYCGIEDILRLIPVFKLSPVDSTTMEVATKLPHLVGIYDVDDGQLLDDPEILKKYQLTEEGKKALLYGENGHELPKEGHPSKK